MKKTILITLIVVLLSFALAGTALAQAGTVVVKGEVKDQPADPPAGTVIVVVTKTGEVQVTLPADFTATLNKGDTVMVKGIMEGDMLLAATVRVLAGKSQGQGGDKPESSGLANSAFCSEDKQDKLHPMFEKLAEKYDVSEELVMAHYCQGHSIGAIMLALKTSQLDTSTDWEGLLTQRYLDGESWGKIWQGLKLIGSEKEVETPPGQLKKNK